ncbi:DUF488 domain-containing protein [Paracoccus yeei]|uniref:DUF488 domain-containing protein n=1 Tax=Paracoccus yeei TaxID=147645 RepID=UPI00048C3F21|nr:DUF488 family protein [Paracoccus yeei]OWJ89622.1 hypothetical protein CDV54_18435 [Paracoccus yeei]
MHRISIRRVYEPAAENEGRTILVDRLWPRAISHAELGDAPWLKDIAPSEDLRHWFAHDPAKWPEFRRRYTAELDANPQAVAELRRLAAQGPLVLLYAARDEQHNNAVVLRDYLGQ